MCDQIDVLLDKVEDAALRKDLLAEIERLRAKRSFGLVFEAHLPERVRLPEHAVRVGGSVVYRDDPEDHGGEFVRIWSIGAGSDGSLRYLDLQDPAVRDEVRAFPGGKVTALYEGPRSMPYE